MNELANIHFIFEVVFVGLVLSVDSFSAAVAMGCKPFSKKEAFRFAVSSGAAEAVVALIGALAGSQVIRRFDAIDHWIAFTLLGLVSLHMGYEGVRDLLGKEKKDEKLDFHSFTKVLIVSFATSLDAFGVGIGLGISQKPLIPFTVSIGFWAFATTLLGLHLGKKLSSKVGSIMSLVGATILGLIAFQMLKI